MEKQYGICYTYEEGGTSMEWCDFEYWIFHLNDMINCGDDWEVERVDGTVAFLKER